MPEVPPTAAVHGPYEDLAIAIVGLVREIIAKVPPETHAEIWKMVIEDQKEWRAFLKSLTGR